MSYSLTFVVENLFVFALGDLCLLAIEMSS